MGLFIWYDVFNIRKGGNVMGKSLLDFLLDDDGNVAETLRDLSDEDRENEYAKQEEYGDEYFPPQRGW